MSDIFPSISALIPELKSGDQDAWNRLCDKFQTGLSSKTRYLFRSRMLTKKFSPDDLVQETFLKAWKRHASFRGETTSQFAQWMLTILRNTFADWCRDLPRELTVGTWVEFGVDEDTPSSVSISLEQEGELHACLAELDSKYQVVLMLRHFEGLKFSEIAERLELNINTVASLYRRGLGFLTDQLDKCEVRAGTSCAGSQGF